MSVVVATGHRPKPYLIGMEIAEFDPMVALAKRGIEELGTTLLYTGMAWGWDQACAQACIDLKVPFVAVVPFPGQEDRWSASVREFYAQLLSRASHVHTVRPHYGEGVYAERNRWMLEQHGVTHVLALWNGTNKGGTAHAVRIAQRNHIPVKNMFP